MRLTTRTGRLIVLTLVVLLAATSCAAGEPTPAGGSGSNQPAATAAAVPPTVEATAEPAAPTDTPAVEPTQQAEPTPAAPATEAPVVEPAPAGGQRTFVIDPANTVASYEVDEEFLAGAMDFLGIAAGLTKTVGRTSSVEGSLTLNFDSPTPQLDEGAFTVDISTLSSDRQRRDQRIREEWLESARFPVASFTVTEIRNAPEAYVEGEEAVFQVAGDLTVRETTNPAVFDVTATLDGDTIRGVATTSFLMSSFGVTPPSLNNLLTVGDNTVVRIEFVAQAQ